MKKALFLLCLLLPLAGCLKLERDYPERSFYSLETTRPGSSPSAPSFGVLRVAKFQVASPFASRAFVYRTGDLRYEEDFYNRFVASPGELLAGQTARWLAESRFFEGVWGGPSPVEPDYLLEGEVAALYGDFTQKPPRAVLEIVFTATGGAGGAPVVLHRTYRQEAPLSEGSPAALAAGWSRALGGILSALEDDLQKLPRGGGSEVKEPTRGAI